MKNSALFLSIILFVLSIITIGCSSGGVNLISPNNSSNDAQFSSLTTGAFGAILVDTGREIIGVYSVEIASNGGECRIEPVERLGCYHFNLTQHKPNVLGIVGYGHDPSHNNDFYVDIRLNHPYPGSGIDGFDPRVIAVLPANSPLNSVSFPTLQVTANNRVVMEPDGYTKLYDNLSLAGNTNPFKAYFKDQPHRVWSSTGKTQETQRWYIDLSGFAGGIKYYLVCDVSTGFPNPPTPVSDNAKEPVEIVTVIEDSLHSNGGYADIEVTVLDWQGSEWLDVQVECPALFESTVKLTYSGQGSRPNTYVFTGEIGNYKSAPIGDYYCLISAFDGFAAIGTYQIYKIHVNEPIEPVIRDYYYDFSTVDVKSIRIKGEGFGNEQGTSVVYVDGETSGYAIRSWRYDEIVINIPNDNADHTVQVDFNGFQTEIMDLPESSTILLVYNSNNTDSVAIKDYYASSVTGRNISEEMTLGLPLSLDEEINRTQYNEQIRNPIENYIFSHDLKYRIKYIVLAQGIPLKIAATGGSDYTNLDYAAVDSELTLLFNGSYTLAGRILSPYYGRPVGEYFHPFKYKRGNLTMAYLVTRLAAWTRDEVFAEIDRGLNGYSGSEAYGILDGDPGKWYDRMEQAEVIYNNLGIQHLFDNSNVFLTAETIKNPSISQNVLGYTGHGIHHNESPPGGGLYVFELGFRLLNGAIFNTYESFNCTTFNESNRSGHGMVGDWIRIGGTGGIGHVYEPWSDAVGDERFLYPAQLAGNNLAEACYISCKYLSWTETIVGDPLCKVKVY